MEENGKMYYSFGIDYSGFSDARKQIVKYFEEIGFSAEEAGKMADDAIKSMTDTLAGIIDGASNADEAVKMIDDTVGKLNEAIKDTSDEIEKSKMVALADYLKEAGTAIDEDVELFDRLKSSLDKSRNAAMLKTLAAKALSTALKGLALGIAIKALTEFVKLSWKFVSGALAAERAANRWRMEMQFLSDDLEVMREYADNMYDIKKATGASREELRNFRLEQAKLVEQKAAENYNALIEAMRDDERNVDDETFKKATEELKKASAEVRRIRHQNKLDEIQQAKDQKEIDQAALMEQYNTEEAKANLLHEGYAKRAKEIKNGREREQYELQHKLDTAEPGTMLDSQRRDILEQIRLSKELQAKELSDLYKEQRAAIINAEKALQDAEYDIVQKGIDRRNQQRQSEIDLMEDGTAKLMAQMRLDHEQRLVEIEREAKEEADAIAEANKQKWLNEQTVKGLSVTDSDYYASAYYKGLGNGLTEEQQAQIDKDQQDRAAAQNALFAKQQKDLFQSLLKEYGDYTAQKEAIDKKYFNDVTTLERKLTEAQIDGDTETAERLKKAIENAKKEWAKADFNFEMDTIDTTAYATVEEKMDAINKAYEKYKQSLDEAGASAEEIAAIEQERVEVAGKLKTLLAQQEDLERKIKNAISESKDNTDEYENWVKLLHEVEKEIEEITRKTDKATKSSKTFAEFWADAAEAIKNADLPTQIDKVGELVDKMAEVEGSDGFTKLFGYAKDIASGGFAGLFSSIVDIFVDSYNSNMERVFAVQEAQMQARLDFLENHYEDLLEGKGNMFGDDMLGSAQQYLDVLDEIEKKTKYAYALFYGGKDFNLDNALNGSVVGNNGVLYNQNAINNLLQGDAANISFKTKNGFIGIGQEYLSFQQLSEQLGIDLYDEFGNLNADLAQAILNTYDNTLLPKQKEFLESVIKDSEAYKEAMEGIANYLKDLFGGVADTIADNFINSFLESGQAAANFGNVVSDVAKSMVKDLIKSKILTALDPFSQQLQNIMTGEGSQDEKIAAMMAVFASMQETMDELTPDMQAILEAYQQFFDMGDSGREPSTKGIAQASQDSVDELKGRMTTVQGHTYSISENTILIQQNTANIMQSVMNIERDVNDMDNRIYNVETMTTQMRNTLDDFRQNGIRIR